MKYLYRSKKIVSILLCFALLMTYLPLTTVAATPLVENSSVVTDSGTAHTWESMMGTATDGNRYAGRVWADKSVYKNGDTVVLNTKNTSGSSFQVALEEDEAFQVVFSALGSSMTTTTTTSSTGPMDVVLVLDNSVSMNTTSGGTTRMQKVIEAANKLLAELMSNNNDVRLGITAYSEDSSTVLPFAKYTNGVTLRVNSYTGSGSSNGIITAYDSTNRRISNSHQSAGYANYTNTQAGFDLAMEMLGNATNVVNRKPVVILLTDGAANTAVDTLFMNNQNGTVRQVYYSNNIDPMIALSTLLSAAYNKARVEDHYGRSPMIYGVGVDLSSSDGSNAIIDPQKNFNSSNSNSNIRSAYNTYTQTWLAGNNVSVVSGTGSGWGGSNYTFRFGHTYPDAGITDADIAANINYVDTYYPVASANLESVFDQIYQELSSGVFNPISSTTTVEGATGVQNTPLIYVDFIGKYMEVKEIQSVTLFGSSYSVLKNSNGTYTVQTGTGKNPATSESYNTGEDIRIRITETDNIQKLQIEIDQEILPILLEKVDDKNINGERTTSITEIAQDPLRIYYTVGIASDILLPNGEIDVTKIDSSYSHINGNEITFYSNQFGIANPTDVNGNAHVGFKPSAANRYYYHQTNQDIFTAVSRKDGQPINWQADEYGVRYEKDTFNFSWLTYDNYNSFPNDAQVYTYVTYYRPIAANSTVAEEVTYLVYTSWDYLKDSVAFYDNNAKTYINYHENSSYETGDVGYAIPKDKVTATINAYKQANPNAEIYGTLGMESLRTSRLHNMTVAKTSNATGTDAHRYSPVYTHDTASLHHGNDVVIWLGNNGTFTTTIDTGIALSKAVKENIGDANDLYALTVKIPAGVSATPVVEDAHGNNVTSAISTYLNNILTVNVKADETVYISGIPAGTTCEIGETIPDGKDYYVYSKTDTVTIPSLEEVLNGAAQFAPATVTNAPNKYGDLTIIKDIAHNLTSMPADMANKVFTFKVQLPVELANKEYQVDKANASEFTADKITVGADGSFTVNLKDNESITVLNLPAGTDYTVSETSNVAGYQNAADIHGTIEADGDHDAHFVNTYEITPIKPAITITGTKTVTSYGSTYSDNEDFIFELSQYVGVSSTYPSGYKSLGTDTAKDGGKYEFNLHNLLTEELDIGEYYFRVMEQPGTTDGMTYDASRGLFKVTVTDTNADGTLEHSVENTGNTNISGDTVTKNFENIYDVSKTHVDINIIKTLDNTTGVNIPLNRFHFTLVNKKNANESYTVTTDAAGNATIRVPELDEGIYEYELIEIEDTTWRGMQFDTTPRIIKITVDKQGSVLTAVTEIDGIATNAVTFTNEYALAATSHTIQGNKVLSGRDLKDNDFQFALYETDSSFDLSANAVLIETVKNTGDSFSFSTINYTEVGTYYYSVKEVNGGKSGITYDTTHYHITVTVSVDGAALKKEVVVNKIGHNEDSSGGIVFVNSYSAKPTEFAISGTKVLTSRAINAGEFTFELYEGNIKKGEATNKADGTFTFDAIAYTKPGTYTYTVKERIPADNDKLPGITYSNTGVEVAVIVTDSDAKLSASADKSTAQIIIENKYDAADATVTFNGTKTLVGRDLENNTFTFKLYQTDRLFDITANTAELHGTAKNVDNKFSFTKKLSATGTYFFVIVEDAAVDPIEDVVYDSTEHHFVVQVRDIGDGKLKAVITNVNTGITGEESTSVSANVAFTNATYAEAAKKEVYLANSTTSQVDGKKVYAGDILTYYISYTNYTGEDLVVDIMDTIPAHTTYVENSASLNGTYAGDHINWILNVGKGESVTVSFQVKVAQADTPVTNAAVIRDGHNTYTTNEVQTHITENAVEKDVFLSSAPDVSINGKQVATGDVLVYSITYHNNMDRAVKVTITDTLSQHIAYVEGSVNNNGTYTNGTLAWSLDLAAGESKTVSFQAKVTGSSVTIENQAKAIAANHELTTNIVSNTVSAPPAVPETPVVPETPTTPVVPEVPATPQTGDEMNLALWLGLLLVSSVGMTVLVVSKKRIIR